MVDENVSPGAEPQKSGGGSVLLWILAIAAVGLVVCCGGVGVVAWKFRGFVAEMATSDPAEIRKQTAEMVDINIPDKYKPLQGMNMVVVRLVIYQTAPAADGSSAMLMLMAMTMDQIGISA